MPLARLLLAVGDEELLVERTVADAVAQARAADPATEVHAFAAAELSPAALLEAASPSLFGGARVVIIADLQGADRDAARAVTGLAGGDDTELTLVATHDGGARGRPLLEALRRVGAEVVSCPRVRRPSERLAFVRDEARRAGGSIEEAAAQDLIAAVGSDLRELAAACSQLVADAGGRIGADDVARYHRGRAEVSGFTVADAAVAGDAAGALAAVRWARSLGVDPVPIADAIADGIRTVARVAGSRAPAAALASALRLPPWKVERAQRQARGWSAAGLAEATRLVATLNADVKGSAADQQYALERAVLALSQARARR